MFVVYCVSWLLLLLLVLLSFLSCNFSLASTIGGLVGISIIDVVNISFDRSRECSCIWWILNVLCVCVPEIWSSFGSKRKFAPCELYILRLCIHSATWKKAYTQNQQILQPLDGRRKTVIGFCKVGFDLQTIALYFLAQS